MNIQTALNKRVKSYSEWLIAKKEKSHPDLIKHLWEWYQKDAKAYTDLLDAAKAKKVK